VKKIRKKGNKVKNKIIGFSLSCEKNLCQVDVKSFTHKLFSGIEVHDFNEDDYLFLYGARKSHILRVQNVENKNDISNLVGKFKICHFYSSSEKGRNAFYATILNTIKKQNNVNS